MRVIFEPKKAIYLVGYTKNNGRVHGKDMGYSAAWDTSVCLTWREAQNEIKKMHRKKGGVKQIYRLVPITSYEEVAQ